MIICTNVISIHALLAESDRAWTLNINGAMKFLSTLSLRRATPGRAPLSRVGGISIHALLAESDRREGPRCQGLAEFLSTLSLRRATILFGGALLCIVYFYPRSPCGERHLQCQLYGANSSISIHALLAESDAGLPVAGRIARRISIHALLAESDVNDAINGCNPDFISIHALLAESDIILTALLIQLTRFLSTLSLRRATFCRTISSSAGRISIHALLAESDCLYRLSLIMLPISIHALLAESDSIPGRGHIS